MGEQVIETGPLVLVADDVVANVELLFDQLHTLGYRTIAAYDGPSAVAACFEHNPDICILDVSMPAGDLGVDTRSVGFEVCRRIKRDPRTSRIPVIFVTALNDTGDRVRGIEAGGDDFLTKPLDREAIRIRLAVAERILRYTAEIRQLQEMIPICTYCHKVRDTHDYWDKVESYIQKETGSRFSHGACPECYEKEMERLLLEPNQSP